MMSLPLRLPALGKFDCAIGNMSSDDYVPVERSKMTFISIHIFANQNL